LKKLISIIIPTYNRAHLISETIDSILEQTYIHWECIIVDDDSSDNTEQIIKLYSEKDDRIKFYHRPKNKQKGASSSRNYGLEKSHGYYIQFLDSDDIISKGKLGIQVELLEQDPLNSLATCTWGMFKNDINDAEIYHNLKSYNDFEEPLEFIEALGKSLGFFPIHAYLIRKSIITKAGYWNEYLSLNDDAEFMVRVIVNSHKICFAEDCKAFYRLPTNNNLSSYNDEGKVIDAINSWKLIEANLKIRFKKDEFFYLKNAIDVFYSHSKIFPEIIKKNKQFFRIQLWKDSSWIRKYFFRK
jgi:glycosyltransferase involved in cell wall biosynthesis